METIPIRNTIILGDNLQVLHDASTHLRADAVITSPPYLLGQNPYHRAKGAKDIDFYTGAYKDGSAFWSKEQPVQRYIDNMVTLFRGFERVVREDGPVVINLSYGIEHPSLPQRVVVAIEEQTNYMLADTLAWNKLRSMPLQASPSNCTRIVEWVFVFCRKTYHKRFRTNKRVTSENWKQKFYEFIPNYIEAINNYDGPPCSLVAHYSVGFVDRLLRIYVPEQSVVLDPFMGSGTTAISCMRNGRDYIGIEIDPVVYNVAQQRIEEEKKTPQSTVTVNSRTEGETNPKPKKMTNRRAKQNGRQENSETQVADDGVANVNAPSVRESSKKRKRALQSSANGNVRMPPDSQEDGQAATKEPPQG